MVKLAFERPTVFKGKSVGLTVDRLDLQEYVQKVNDNLNEDKKHPWTYEQVTTALCFKAPPLQAIMFHGPTKTGNHVSWPPTAAT